MPRFYFDISGNDTLSDADGIGKDFASITDAKSHAMTLLPIMGVELPLNEGEFRTWTASVRDEGDKVVCRFIMAIINDQISPAGRRVLRPMAE